MIIRRAIPEDAERLVNIVNKIYVRPSYSHYADPKVWCKFINNHSAYVAEDRGAVIASAALEDCGNHGLFTRSFVHSDYRKKGIYKKLFNIRMSEAVSRKHKYVESHAATHHTIVQNFLLKEGFSPIGIEIFAVNDIADTGQKGTLVLMRRPLTDDSMIPKDSPIIYPGMVPTNYSNESGWQYQRIPQGFDSSLISIIPQIKDRLNIQVI